MMMMACGKSTSTSTKITCTTIFLWAVVSLVVISDMTMVAVNARYLPTRGQDDRIERLRELLKDLLGNQYDYTGGDNAAEPAGLLSSGRAIPQHSVMFKREIPSSEHQQQQQEQHGEQNAISP